MTARTSVIAVFFFFFSFLDLSAGEIPDTLTLRVDSMLRIVSGVATDSVKVNTYIELSKEVAFNNIKKSMMYADQASQIARLSGNRKLMANASYHAGVACFSLGLLEQAATHFYEYLEYAKSTGKKDEISRGLINISAVQLQMKQFDKAEETLLNGLDFYLLNPDGIDDSLTKTILASIYNNLGIVSKEKEDLKKAESFYQKGIAAVHLLKPQHQLHANLMNNLGMVYILQKEYDKAFPVLTMALRLREDNDDLAGIAASHRNLGLFYQKTGNAAEAKNHFYQAIRFAKQTGSPALLEGIYSNVFELYNSAHKADSALKYLILLNQQLELLNHEETAKVLTQMELNMQFKEREKLQKAEQERKEQQYLFVSMLLVAVAIIIGLLFFLSQARLRRAKLERTNSELANKNLQLTKESLEVELETKNKELATNVMYQLRKNEIVDGIVQKLLNHSHQFKSENKELIQSIIHDLEKTMEEDVWSEFEMRFQHVHNDFYQRLNDIHPDLSPNERRLCAFLKLNMTTKEIAAITGQSQRSIEVARTRLRKKLDLTNSEQGLIEFLSQL